MHIILEVIRSTAQIILFILQIAMMARAVLSWFPMNDSKLADFLYSVTEPVIFPVRLLFEKMNWAGNLPIDIPFFVTFLLLSIIEGFL